jgi:hypothetical protein
MRGAVAVTAAELSSGRAMMRGHATAIPRHRARPRPPMHAAAAITEWRVAKPLMRRIYLKSSAT